MSPVRILAALLVAAAFAAGLTTAVADAAETPATAAQQLDAAAAEGPRALIERLATILQTSPYLVATPDSAARLARAAASPVSEFVGAGLPIYDEIADRIIAAAPPSQRDAVRQAVAAAMTTFVATDLRVMPSVQVDTIGNVRLQPPDVGQTGYRVGSFTIYPSVQAGGFFDSNIYATSSGRVSDWVGTISPVVAAQSNWKKNSLSAEAGVDLTGYMQHGNENTIDWHTQVDSTLDAGKDTSVVLGALAMQEHEDRSSPDAVEGITPTPYYELNGYAGIVHRIGDVSLRFGGAIERITFGNVEGTHGEINNQDRNQNRYTIGFLAREQANTNFQPYVELLGDFRYYDQSPDDFGYYRNSNGYRAGIGTVFRLLPDVSGFGFIGVMGRTYADPRFQQITTPAAAGNLTWQVRSSTALILFVDRSIEETTLPGSPAYIYTVGGGRIEQDITKSLTAYLRLALAYSNFVQVTQDMETDASVGLRYWLTRRVFLGLDYRYTQRNSPDPYFVYGRNEVFLSVSSTF